jgi:adenylylsulfate kinase-like enzyme
MTEHIYAHEHPETERRRDGGFTLWFTGLSGSGKTTIAHLVGPAIEERGRRTAMRTSSASAGWPHA